MSRETEIDSNKKWEENDLARTLSEAMSIKSDKKKMKMAKTGAKRLADEKMKEAKALQKIAGKSGSKDSGVNLYF